jgi:hypothetical protein
LVSILASVEMKFGQSNSRLLRIPTRGLPITIVRLAGLPNEVINSVVWVLARLAFEKRRTVISQPTAGKPSARPGRRSAGSPRRGEVGSLARGSLRSSLGARFDRAVAVFDLFAMRLANELDKLIMPAAAGSSASSTVAFLSLITDREAIAFGEAIVIPMRMKFADISARPGERRAGQRRRARCGANRLEAAGELPGEAGVGHPVRF